MGAFDDNRKKRGIKGKRGGGINHLRYIIGLILLLLIFIWLLMVDMEPWLEVLLTEEKPVPQCQMESGDVKQVNDIIFAPLKDGSDLLWLAHTSEAVGECVFREAGEEGLLKIPLGLVGENQESDLPGFATVSVTSFRILEEIYCQIYDWHREYGEMRVVSGIFYCVDTVEADLTGWSMFTAFFIPEVNDGVSIAFLWNDKDGVKPLNELVFSLESLNRITGFGVFDDIAARRELSCLAELEGMLRLGYETDFFNQRLEILDNSTRE